MNKGVFFLFAILLLVVSSCGKDNSPTVTTKTTSDYQDMRNRGHSEEDAVIFGILKQQGYSDMDSINAVKSTK